MFNLDSVKKLFSNKKSKKIKEDHENPNRAAKKKQLHNAIAVSIAIVVILIVLGAILHRGEKKTVAHVAAHKAMLDGVLSSDFNQKNTTSALEEQQREVDSLKSNMQKGFKNLNSNLEKTIQAAIAKKEKKDKKDNVQAKTPISAHPPRMPQASDMIDSTSPNTQYVNQVPSIQGGQRPIQQFSFSYQKPVTHNTSYHAPVDPNKKTIRNFVPAGTFSTGILLEGADADASTNGQSNTAGVLIRLLDNGTIANGHHSKLKGCFIVASIYGDISSERGEVRLDRISCTKHDGTIIQKSVEGYVSFAGKQGVRGRVVSRNGKLLLSSSIAGALSGFGDALQQGMQTVNQTAMGAVTTIAPGNVMRSGGYGGAGKAMDMLAKYYIQSANNIHPVIEIPSGTKVTVIFQQGFSLLGDDDSKSPSKPATTSSGLSKQDIMKFMSHAKAFTPNNQGASNGDQPFSSVGS